MGNLWTLILFVFCVQKPFASHPQRWMEKGLQQGIPASKKEKNEKVTSNAVKIKQAIKTGGKLLGDLGGKSQEWRVSHTAFPRPPGKGWGTLGHVC